MWYVLLARQKGEQSWECCGFSVSLAEAKRKAKVLWDNSDVKEMYIAGTIERCQIKREVIWTKES